MVFSSLRMYSKNVLFGLRVPESEMLGRVHCSKGPRSYNDNHTLRVQVPNYHILSQIVTYITTIRNLST